MQSLDYSCDECSSVFKQKSELMNHNTRAHSDLRPFKCDSCDYRAKTKKSLAHHKFKHLPEAVAKPLRCPKCPFKCRLNYDLNRHIQTHTGEKLFKCPLCPHRAIKAGNLTTHIRTHTGEKQFKCSHCVYYCSTRANLKVHIQQVHVNKGERPFKCIIPGCGKNYTTREAVRTHVQRSHEKKTKFQCPDCSKRFYYKSYCDVHIIRCITKEKPFKCGQCDYTAATAMQVNTHEATRHTDYLNVECLICQKTYKNKQSLAAHEYREHRERPREKPRKLFICQEESCTKEFQSAFGLKRHKISFHLNLRPFKCPFCEHSSSTSDKLSSHVKTHTGERPFKCKECKSSFITRVCLRIHERTRHSELRPFECPDCDYKAKTKAIMRRHRRTHDASLRLECTICKESQGTSISQRGEGTGLKPGKNRFFKNKSTLESHMRGHSYEIPFKCQHCPYTAKVPRYLKMHIKRMHLGLSSKDANVDHSREAQHLHPQDQNRSKASSSRNIHKVTVPSSPAAGATVALEAGCKPCYVRLVRLRIVV